MTGGHSARCSENLPTKKLSAPRRGRRKKSQGDSQAYDIPKTHLRKGGLPLHTPLIEGATMKTEWDYTKLADAYLDRPDYAPEALDRIVEIAGLKAGDRICDVGAGVAHLTLPWLERGFIVDAVEPNDAMRANGQMRTAGWKGVQWLEGTGEHTGCADGMYDFVSFGSSLNVCDRNAALRETHRLLKPGKWFACLWNHRDLDDPIQSSIEAIIRKHIPEYGYGTRREDQTETINASGLFDDIHKVEGCVRHSQSVERVTEAWRSHATLHRQAQMLNNGNDTLFFRIIDAIAGYLHSLSCKEIQIPYTTRAWVARRKA